MYPITFFVKYRPMHLKKKEYNICGERNGVVANNGVVVVLINA